MPSGSENESDKFAPRPLRFGLLVAASSALLAAGVVASACGPSVQSIYEGNVRFEHCYRLDLEVDAAPTHRQACWKEWLGMYTYGQPRDRIEYARQRTQAFASGDANRPSLDIGGAAEKKTEARQFYLVVPSPTSVHASPPPIATRWYADAGSPPATETERTDAPVPGEQCAAGCLGKHTECATCAADAGTAAPASGCKACDSDYKACMKRCFQ